MARWTWRKWIPTTKDFLRIAEDKYRSYYYNLLVLYNMETLYHSHRTQAGTPDVAVTMVQNWTW